MANITVTTSGGATSLVSIGSRGPAGPAGAGGGGATPAGTTGSVQINNAGALAADSGLVFTGTGDTGVLKVGGGQIAINALPYSGGGTLTSNIGIGFNPFTPTSNVTLSNNVQGNIGIGDNALDSLNSATGYNTNNIAIGTFALSSLNTCQSSVFIGTYAGMFLTADSNSSTIIGDAAGVYYGTGYLSLTQAAGCTFLGRLTKGSAAVSSNQIVIGSSAIGDQDNSTVIGNTNTTQTRLAGNTLKLGSSTLNTSIAQTATGSSKTITLPNASGTVALTDVGQTFSGLQQFSTRPTSSGTGTPEATSLMNRTDVDDWEIWNMDRVVNMNNPALITINNAVVASSGFDGDYLRINTSDTAARPIISRSRNITVNPASGGTNQVLPVKIGMLANIGISNNGNVKARFYHGGASSSTPAFSDAQPITGKGFGWEASYNVSLARYEMSLFAHNGTTYVSSDGVSERPSPLVMPSLGTFGLHYIILELSGSGVVTLWISATRSRPSNTPSLVLSGGPTSGNYGTYGGASWTLVGLPTGTAGGISDMKIQDRKMILTTY
jgi:hypothetical protein